jgi:signal transduction histidine kinase
MNKNENLILNIIKYSPIVIVIILSIFITKIFLNEIEIESKKEIQILRDNYININKKRIKEETEKVYKFIKKEKESSEEQLKDLIKSRVYIAHKLITDLYTDLKKEDNNHFRNNEYIFNTIKNVLSSIIYDNGNGYFFMYDKNATLLVDPLNKNLIGKKLFKKKEIENVKLTKDIIKTIKNNTESFHSYFWYKNDDQKKLFEKISFYKYFEPFNIVIGTGTYLKDFEDGLKTNLINQINKISFSDDGNIFLLNKNGDNLSKDEKSNSTTKDIITFASKNKNSSLNSDIFLTSSENKIFYIKSFEDWDWIIVSEFNLDSIDIKIKEKIISIERSNNKVVNEIIFISLLITLILVIVSFYISKLIANKFQDYNNDLKKEITKTIEKEKLLIQQSKMATMGEMIANIAHQWKQPLSIISVSNGMLQLQQEHNMFNKEDIDDAINSINNAISNLTMTINDFTSFFNPNKEPREFYIQEAIEKTIKLTASQFVNKNIQLIMNISNIKIHGLENELLQTLINILNNAKDQLLIINENEEKFIFISTYAENNNLTIKIKDNAKGIKEEIIYKIFDPYFTTKTTDKGTGIGLSMCKMIIESMHGSISVSNTNYEYNSKEYKGAEFNITIPINFK